LLTARQDFGDKDKFLEFLVKHGIEAGHKDDQKVHVIKAGNIPGLDNARKKYNSYMGPKDSTGYSGPKQPKTRCIQG